MATSIWKRQYVLQVGNAAADNESFCHQRSIINGVTAVGHVHLQSLACRRHGGIVSGLLVILVTALQSTAKLVVDGT